MPSAKTIGKVLGLVALIVGGASPASAQVESYQWQLTLQEATSPAGAPLTGAVTSIMLSSVCSRVTDPTITCTEDHPLPGGQTNATPVATTLTGQGGAAQLRGLLYGTLANDLDLMQNASELRVEGAIGQGSVLELRLDARPGTGAKWNVDPLDPAVSVISEVNPDDLPSAPGAAQRVSLRFTSEQAGGLQIVARYGRPWLSPATPNLQLTISSPSLAGALDLSTPALPAVPLPPEVVPGSVELPIGGNANLPSSFDGRDLGWVTPVQNQTPDCGSCWAFATVAAMEHGMAKEGLQFNLSEQYLLDCNKDGWTCTSGGYEAHAYHLGTPGKGQSTAGAVLEADKKYTARYTGQCPALPHPQRLANWGTLHDYDETAIKTVIQNYGAVVTWLCIGDKFDEYRGGIFDSNADWWQRLNCKVWTPNHLALLVGWNDSEDTWILKNSWGTGWGESGYMRIKRDVAMVGKRPSYVYYRPSAPVSPQLSVSWSTPSAVSLTWTDSDVETGYVVERRIAEGPWGEVGRTSQNETWFAEYNLLNATQYLYRVKAENSARFAYSNEIILTTGLPAPSNLRVAAVPASVSKLVLSWTDNSNNEDGFQIYRKSVGTGTGWAPVRYSPANSTTWQDSGLQPGTTYRYRILAKVPARSSGPAMDSEVAEASATTNSVPAIAVTGCVLVEPDANASAPCVFSVSLSAAIDLPVTVSYATADGTALAGTDYTAASGTVAIPPGLVRQDVPVNVLGDQSKESAREVFTLAIHDPVNGVLVSSSATGTIIDNDQLRYYVVPGCRIADTRYGNAPSLSALVARTFAVVGTPCGIPGTAKAIAVNVTALNATTNPTTNPAGAGHLILFASGSAVPRVSAVNFTAGVVRASNAIVALGAGGSIDVWCGMPAGTVDVVLDVAGYFE